MNCSNFIAYVLLFFALNYGRVTEAEGLYSDDDDVVILTGQKFKDDVFNSSYLWLVEFYAASCGHCQNFAPTYKSLAKNVKAWQELIKLAVINCPTEDNKEICRGMGVQGYPTIRFFEPFSNSSNKGIEAEGRTGVTLRNEIITTIEQSLDRYKFDDEMSRPYFSPLTYVQFKEIAYGTHGKYYRAFVLENSSSTMGKEIIMDVSPCSNITVRRVDPLMDDGKRIAVELNVDLDKLPHVVVVSADKATQIIEVEIKVRNFYTYQLEKLPGIMKEVNLNENHSTEITTKAVVVPWQNVDRSRVYMSDIESSIRYSFTNEITSFTTIEGERLASLKEYLLALSLLAKHLPFLSTTSNFIVRMQQWVESKTSVGYNELEQEVKLKNPDDFLPTANRRWVGCVGSEPNKRGYPCSLWTLFHSMTVAAHNANIQDISLVPKAIYAYITNFFGCTTCAENVKKEVEKVPFPVGGDFTTEDTVMWLWTLHNSVNTRLHGDLSEDKQFEKVQFPTRDFCFECSNSNLNWNNDYVFQFLIHRYSKEHVSMDYMNDKTKISEKNDNLHLEEEEVKPAAPNMQVNAMFEEDYDHGAVMAYEHIEKAIDGEKDHILHNELQENRAKNIPQDPHEFVEQIEQGFHPRNIRLNNKYSRWLPRGFSNLDRNICVMIWLLSMTTVLVVYAFIRLKRRYRPKKFRIH